MEAKKCKIRFPTIRALDYAVSRLRELYPSDPIGWKGGGREQAEQAVAIARWTFKFSRGRPCYERKLLAAATLFYEIIMLHPLVDGNKRLATTMLWAFLKANKLPRPKNIADAALKVASREWGQEDVHQWLLRVYRARKRRSA